MTWTFDTGAKYHTQDTDYYCGAACAMMVLAEIGLPYTAMNQVDLYDSNHTHSQQPDWYSDPYGLRYTLVDRKPASFANTFVVYKPTTEEEGTRKIVYTLWRYGVSPVVLVYHCMHWIVVRGVQTDVEPTAGAAYTVNGFWINNPVYHDNSPHSATDVCGSGGVNGVENQWVSYAYWQNTLFTGCNYDSPTGSSQFISVCDPEEPKIELPRRPSFDPPFDGREIIPSDVAVRSVYEGIERFELYDAKDQMAKLREPRFEAPILVKRLDRPDSHYYLSPAMLDGAVFGFGQVDAVYGDLQSVYILEEPTRPYDLDRETIAKSVLDRTFDLPEKQGQFRLRPDTFSVSPTLVWQPCRESYSPHLPFWQITAGGQSVFVRADGQVYSQLTVTGAGV